jgi:5-methylcytosine-specific restriction protein A
MRTYVLTWNPKRWKWSSLDADVAAVACGRQAAENTWSTGNTRSIEPGDRLFLLKLGTDPRGIMGSGVAESRPTEEPHWDEAKRASGATALRVRVRFDRLVAPDSVLEVEFLRANGLGAFHWSPQASGISMQDDLALRLGELWRAHVPAVAEGAEAQELTPGTSFREGAAQVVVVNRYERDPAARRACIARWGTACSVCGFSFEATYGERGRDYVQVHHLHPLAQAGGEVAVDPERDLRPVCANCHAMIHRGGVMLTPDELRRAMSGGRSGGS